MCNLFLLNSIVFFSLSFGSLPTAHLRPWFHQGAHLRWKKKTIHQRINISNWVSEESLSFSLLWAYNSLQTYRFQAIQQAFRSFFLCHWESAFFFFKRKYFIELIDSISHKPIFHSFVTNDWMRKKICYYLKWLLIIIED